MEVRRLLKVHGKYLALHLKTAMEYRVNFLTQSVFMVLNDAIFALVFVFLFSAFPVINGYTMEYAMLLFGITALGFGVIAVLFGNRRQLAEVIMRGELDTYLTLPIDELYHALMSRSAYDGFGDILFGLGMILWFAPQHALIGIVGALLGGVILLSFMILIDTLGFFFQRPKEAVWSLNMFLLSFSCWPSDAYTEGVRVFIYAIPIAFIGTVPYHLIANFSWQEFGALALVAATMLLLSILTWKWGLRKYESGNLMTTRA